MTSAQQEFDIEESFMQSCYNKTVCSMYLDYQQMYGGRCYEEILRRQDGNWFYGPPKIYTIALCEIDDVWITGT